jgi:hypothetical protein
MKKKILLIESLMHFWQVSDLHKLFSKNFHCDVLVPKKYAHLIDLKHGIITSPLKYFIFLHAIFIGKKYDYIYLVTSPEYPEFPTNLKSFLIYFQQLIVFTILLFFFKKKIILYIRGIYRVVPEINISKNKFYINLRKKLFLKVSRFVCENRNLEKVFKNKFILKKRDIYLTTLYTRFFDPNQVVKKKVNNNILTIGVLGAIDPIRKDYNLLEDFVRINNSKVQLIFLGRKYKRISDPVLDKFKKYNIITKSYLTDKDFVNLGSRCHVLLSLNKEDKMYGTYKGTGSYGDALKLQQKIICPSFTDPLNEFADFSLYYSSKKELESLLSKLLTDKKFFNPKFSNFSIDKIRVKCFKELKLI